MVSDAGWEMVAEKMGIFMETDAWVAVLRTQAMQFRDFLAWKHRPADDPSVLPNIRFCFPSVDYLSVCLFYVCMLLCMQERVLIFGCVYVRVYMCMYGCMYIYMYVYLCVCMYVCMYVRMCICMCVFM